MTKSRTRKGAAFLLLSYNWLACYARRDLVFLAFDTILFQGIKQVENCLLMK
jgi:hypothetical protein